VFVDPPRRRAPARRSVVRPPGGAPTPQPPPGSAPPVPHRPAPGRASTGGGCRSGRPGGTAVPPASRGRCRGVHAPGPASRELPPRLPLGRHPVRPPWRRAPRCRRGAGRSSGRCRLRSGPPRRGCARGCAGRAPAGHRSAPRRGGRASRLPRSRPLHCGAGSAPPRLCRCAPGHGPEPGPSGHRRGSAPVQRCRSRRWRPWLGGSGRRPFSVSVHCGRWPSAPFHRIGPRLENTHGC